MYRSLLLFPALILLGSCQACPADARARVLAPDYRTPGDGARTFLAALSCDDALTEYRSLSEAMKEEDGATLDAYLLARPGLRDELGMAADFAFRLDLVEEVAGRDGTRLLWFAYRSRVRVGLVMQAQHYFDVETGPERRTGAFLDRPPSGYLSVDGRTMRVELEDSSLRRIAAEAVTRLELGTEWKLRDVLPAENDARPPRP